MLLSQNVVSSSCNKNKHLGKTSRKLQAFMGRGVTELCTSTTSQEKDKEAHCKCLRKAFGNYILHTNSYKPPVIYILIHGLRIAFGVTEHSCRASSPGLSWGHLPGLDPPCLVALM